MEKHPPVYLGVVAIERGAFGSPLTLLFYLQILEAQHIKPKSLEFIELNSKIVTMFWKTFILSFS